MRDILVFVGHDFFGRDAARKCEYRQAIAVACERANRDGCTGNEGVRYTVAYGDTRRRECPLLFERIRERKRFSLRAGYWDEIRAKIDACDYAIFDLTNQRVPNPPILNANVVLEYGVAIGYDKPYQIIGRVGMLDAFRKHLSNTHGIQLHQYDTIASLQAIIEDILTDYPYRELRAEG